MIGQERTSKGGFCWKGKCEGKKCHVIKKKVCTEEEVGKLKERSHLFASPREKGGEKDRICNMKRKKAERRGGQLIVVQRKRRERKTYGKEGSRYLYIQAHIQREKKTARHVREKKFLRGEGGGVRLHKIEKKKKTFAKKKGPSRSFRRG